MNSLSVLYLWEKQHERQALRPNSNPRRAPDGNTPPESAEGNRVPANELPVRMVQDGGFSFVCNRDDDQGDGMTWKIIENSWSDTTIETGGEVQVLLSIEGAATEENQEKLEHDMDRIAKLIAAAPEIAAERDRLKESNGELLEALKGMLTEYSPYHGSTKKICAAQDKACAAIKNAEANHG